MNKKQSYEFYLKRFQEIIVFLVGKDILKHYKSLEDYKKASNSDKAYNLNDAISPKQTKILTSCYVEGKWTSNFDDFLLKSTSLFKYHRHCHKTFKSGKKFSRKSWFELTDDLLVKVFDSRKSWNTKNQNLVSKDSHKWLDKHIFGYNNKIEEENMNLTKQEREDIKFLVENGRTSFSEEELVKDALKKKRTQERVQKSRMEKIAQQVYNKEHNNEELIIRIKELEEEIAHYKELLAKCKTMLQSQKDENDALKLKVTNSEDIVEDDAEKIELDDNKKIIEDNNVSPSEEEDLNYLQEQKNIIDLYLRRIQKCVNNHILMVSEATKICSILGRGDFKIKIPACGDTTQQDVYENCEDRFKFFQDFNKDFAHLLTGLDAKNKKYLGNKILTTKDWVIEKRKLKVVA